MCGGLSTITFPKIWSDTIRRSDAQVAMASQVILCFFYNFRDVGILKKFSAESANKEVEEEKLRWMQEFANARHCRRHILLAYFGEKFTGECGNCDICLHPPKYFDGTELVQKALSGVVRAKEKIGIKLLIDVLRGSNRKEIYERRLNAIPTYGVGSDLPEFDWQQYITQMTQLGLLEIAYDDGYVLRITPAGTSVLEGKEKVQLADIMHLKKNS